MPSWRVHREILRIALNEVCLGDELAKGLFEGVVDPDKRRDYRFVVHINKGSPKARWVPVKQHGGINKKLVNYYFNLALYYYRQGNAYLAGLALGRALHYVQDGVLRRTKYLIFDVHDKLEKEIGELLLSFDFTRCGGEVKVSSSAGEVLCSAYVGTVKVLRDFVEEASRSFNVKELRVKVLRVKLIKWLAGLGALGLSLTNPPFTLALLPLVIAIAKVKPRTYWEAMRAGLLIVKPSGYLTAI